VSVDGSVLLELDGVHTFYGTIEAIKGISLTVNEGEIVTLIGANGAGKSTTLRSIQGINRPKRGRIVFKGQDIVGRRPHDIVKLGISQSPEGRRLFSRMSVRENLEMGAFRRLWPRRDRGVAADMELVFELFPRLRERERQPAGLLSGGEQQMLAIGRALMSRPRLLLLDEPSMGLAPRVVQEIFATIRRLNTEGISILLAEQNANMALRSAARGYVIAEGEITSAADSGVLASDPSVRAAYLGL
jgi:branched-chain amino acid transport system ATP-binding protein